MRSIILAAARGSCLRQSEDRQLPKHVLQFGGMSLARLQFDTIDGPVGIFRFGQAGAKRLAMLVADYAERDCAHLPHERAVRDPLRERSRIFEVAGTPQCFARLPG